MADIQVVNTDADLSDNTLITEENAYTITGLHTFSRSTNAPFAVNSGAAVVANLDADKLDGQEGSYYLAAANATGTLAVNRGGTGAATFTDGGVLLGSGTSAITAMAVLTDGQVIVGDGSGDPVAESGATLRTSVGVGTGDSPQFTGLTISGTGASSLDVGGGINAGTGNVSLVGTDGKLEGPLSSTIIDDLSGANLTTLNASNISSGTLAAARLPAKVTVTSSDADALDVTGGLTIGSGDVALVGTDGKLSGPLSTTIIDDLSGANLTTLNASNLSSGTVATARLGSGTASSSTFLRGDSSWAAATINSSPYITAAVGSDALTISVVSAAAAAPSSGAPVDVVFRNVTPATGSPTTISLTGATTLVIPSGATMGTTNDIPFRLWIVAFNDAGTVRVGAINCAGASSIYALGGWGITSATVIGTGADSAQIFYGSAAVTSKAYTVLGYVTYESGLSTAGAYASVPTRAQTFGPGVALPGAALQRIGSTYATAVSSSSSTLADTGLTATLTPSSAANAVQVSVSMGQIQKHTGNTGLRAKLLRDTTVLSFPAETNLTNALTAQQSGSGPSVSYLDLPKSAGALVYKMQFASQANIAAVVVQLGNTTSSMTLEEVQG